MAFLSDGSLPHSRNTNIKAYKKISTYNLKLCDNCVSVSGPPSLNYVTGGGGGGIKMIGGGHGSNSDLAAAEEMGEQCRHVESEPEHLPLGVAIQHLTKVYSNGKVTEKSISISL